jgi:hypothetical protein
MGLALLVAAAGFTAIAGWALRREPHRVRLWGAFVCGLALTAAAGYGVWRDARAGAELAAFVRPFPGLREPSGVPSLTPGTREWIFRTAASPAEVRRFYRDEAHRPGWTIVKESDVLVVLARANDRLMVSFTRDGRGETQMVYTLTQGAGR